MNYIKIIPEYFTDSFDVDINKRWRSLELFLLKHSRKYECNTTNNFCTIEVADKRDAVLLTGELPITKFEYVSNTGESIVIDIYPKVKKGQRKHAGAMVYLQGATSGVPMSSHNKKLKNTTISKSTIIKRGILTKAQFEKAIASNGLKVVIVQRTTRVDKDELSEYLDYMYANRDN